MSPSHAQSTDEKELLRAALRAHVAPADDPYRTALRKVTAARIPELPVPYTISTAQQKQTLAEKKVKNKFACSHCPKTFSKRSDRKTHWKETCQYLCGTVEAQATAPLSKLCPICDYVGRNKHQISQHQKLQNHNRGIWDDIRLCDKPRFTCSDDPRIYRTPEDFFAHFNSSTCSLNHHDAHNKWFHHSRLSTLLQEGRDDRGGQHYGTYACLLIHCARYRMTEADWKAVVNSHSEQTAQRFAEKLEWGLVLPPQSPAMMRLGFTSLSQMIATIVPPGNRNPTTPVLSGLAATTDAAVPPHVKSVTLNQQPQRQQYHNYQNSYIQDRLVASIKAASATNSFQRNEGFSAQACAHSADSGRSSSNPLPNRDEIPLQTMAPPSTSANDQLADIQDMWIDSSLDEASFNDALQRDLQPTPWPDMTRTREPREMMLKHTASSVFPAQLRQQSSGAIGMQESAGHLPWETNTEAQTKHTDDARAILNAEAAQETAAVKPSKSKRPISKASEVHPESVMRSQHPQRLPFRLSSNETHLKSRTSIQTTTTGRSAQRESSESTGFFFDYQKYLNCTTPPPEPASTDQAPPPPVSDKPVSMVQGILVPSPGEHFVEALVTQRSSKTTPKEKIKARAKKLFSTEVTELEDGGFFSRPQSGAVKAAQIGQCTLCGKFDNPECLSGHISEFPTQRKRHGTILDGSDLLRDLLDLFG